MIITAGFKTELSFMTKGSIFETRIHPLSYAQLVPWGDPTSMCPRDESYIPLSSGKIFSHELYLVAHSAQALFGRTKIEFFYCTRAFRKFGFSENGGQKSRWELTYFPIFVTVPGISPEELVTALEVTQLAKAVVSIVAEYFACTPAEIHAAFLKDHPSLDTAFSQLQISPAWGGGQISSETVEYSCFIKPLPLPTEGKNHRKNHNKKLKGQAKLAAAALSSQSPSE